MSGRHFLADRDEVSDGFFFFFNTILTDLSGKGGGGGSLKDRAPRQTPG